MSDFHGHYSAVSTNKGPNIQYTEGIAGYSFMNRIYQSFAIIQTGQNYKDKDKDKDKDIYCDQNEQNTLWKKCAETVWCLHQPKMHNTSHKLSHC